MNNDLEWLRTPISKPNYEFKKAAEAHQSALTKPPGSLGKLEQIATTLAAMQNSTQPAVNQVSIVVFAADHGVTAEGVSAFPQAVTAEMVKNFSRGGAAISVLARELGAKLEVVNLGTVSDLGPLDGVVDIKVGPGTANICCEPAMSEQQLNQAMEAGRQAVERAMLTNAQLFIGGEMGIGNTTSAAALACALLNSNSDQLAGPGTGLNVQGVAHKAKVIQQALEHHSQHLDNSLETLRRLGGFEIAALTASYITCAQIGLPVLVDGFISSVAALAASKLCTNAADWFLFSHTSAEPGHRIILNSLDAQPLLDIGMRLGEGSGAATALPLLRLACTLHNRMATFAEAEVSEKEK